MAGLWRSYQALMTRYPWTVQIVTAGKDGFGSLVSYTEQHQLTKLRLQPKVKRPDLCSSLLSAWTF